MDIDIAVIGAGSAGAAAARVLVKEAAPTSWRLYGTGPIPGGVPATNYVRRPITSVLAMGASFSLLQANDISDARVVIVATGRERIPPLAGEKMLRGRGVSYCAACDGDLYRGKRIAAVIADESLVHELDHLAARAEEVIVFASDSIAVPSSVVRAIAQVREIVGDRAVEHILLSDDSAEQVSGVFMLKSELAADVLMPGIELDTDGAVVVGADLSTNLAGSFAAGSVTNAPGRDSQGEGVRAAHSALRLLASR